MCRGMPSCPWDVCGGGPEGALVGFLWGSAEGSSVAYLAGRQRLGTRAFGGRFAAGPALLASG